MAAAPIQDTAKIEKADKGRIQDFLKLLDEIKLLKSRIYNQEVQRLEAERDQQFENSGKDAQKRAKSGSPEEIMRLQSEARRVVEADHERTKEMLAAKYQKIDTGILQLTQFLKELGPIKETESRLAALEEKLRKEQDELNVQRKVLGREQEEFDRDKELIRTSQLAMRDKQKELDAKAANLDVVKRARELDALKKDLDVKVGAYNAEMATLSKMREEFYRDMDQLGEKKAEVEKEAEKIVKEREEIKTARASMADVVAKEMALTFESFVRDMLRPQPPREE
jgi:chromosome segregation ATPase